MTLAGACVSKGRNRRGRSRLLMPNPPLRPPPLLQVRFVSATQEMRFGMSVGGQGIRQQEGHGLHPEGKK